MAGTNYEEEMVLQDESFKLPEEIVFVQFIKKPVGNITNKNHIMFGGMIEGARRSYPVKELKNGKYANVLTDIEKDHLEAVMGMPKNTLSIYNKDSNYWDNLSIALGKEGRHFNLAEPEDYIAIKVLESYTDEIAPSLKELNRQNKRTYKYVIIRGEEEAVVYNQNIDVKKDAFKALGKIEDSKLAMEDFLLMYGKPVAKDSSLEWITQEVNKIADEHPKHFLQILRDPDYKVKLVISKGIKSGYVIHNGGLHQTKDGVNVSSKNTEPTLANAIAYLKSNEGQDLRIRIESELK